MLCDFTNGVNFIAETSACDVYTGMPLNHCQKL